MKQREIRVAELARRLEQPYTTVREWVLFGRQPAEFGSIEKQLVALERKT